MALYCLPQYSHLDMETQKSYIFPVYWEKKIIVRVTDAFLVRKCVSLSISCSMYDDDLFFLKGLLAQGFVPGISAL